MSLTKEIRKRVNRLYYIKNQDVIIARTRQYNKDHKSEVKKRKREWDAFNSALNMKGLCHLCFRTNVEVYNQHGQIMCEECLQPLVNKEEDFKEYHHAS